MKIRLNKSLRAALMACYAISAPIATTVTTGAIITGAALTLLAPQAQATIYTWVGSTDDFHTPSNWQDSPYTNWYDAWCDDYTTDTGSTLTPYTLNVVRLSGTDADNKALDVSFSALDIAGVIVESGAVGYSIIQDSSSNSRTIRLGATQTTDTTTENGLTGGYCNFIIGEDFSIGNSSNYYDTVSYAADVIINVADSKTFTFYVKNYDTDGSGSDGYSTAISGGGTVLMDITTSVTGNGSWTVSGGSTLQLTSNAASLLSVASAVTLTNGNLDVQATAATLSIASTISADADSSVAFTASSGTLAITGSGGSITIAAAAEDAEDGATGGTLSLGTGVTITASSTLSLTLNGTVVLSDAGQIIVSDTAAITLGDDVIFDLSGVTMTAIAVGEGDDVYYNYTYQLFTASGGVTDLSSLWDGIDYSNFDFGDSISTETYTIHYNSDGSISLTDGDLLVYKDGVDFIWSTGENGTGNFYENGAVSEDGYTTEANLTISGNNAIATLGSNVDPAMLTIDGVTFTIYGGTDDDGNAYIMDCNQVVFTGAATLVLGDDVLGEDAVIGTGGNTSATVRFSATDDDTVFAYFDQMKGFAGNVELTNGTLTFVLPENSEDSTVLGFNSLDISGGTFNSDYAIDLTTQDGATGTLSISGGSATFNDALTATTISLTGGESTFSGSVSATSITVSNDGNGTSADFEGTVSLTGAISVSGGEVTFSEAVTAGSISSTGGTTVFESTVAANSGTLAVTIGGGDVTFTEGLGTSTSTVTFNAANSSLTLGGTTTLDANLVPDSSYTGTTITLLAGASLTTNSGAVVTSSYDSSISSISSTLNSLYNVTYELGANSTYSANMGLAPYVGTTTITGVQNADGTYSGGSMTVSYVLIAGSSSKGAVGLVVTNNASLTVLGAFYTCYATTGNTPSVTVSNGGSLYVESEYGFWNLGGLASTVSVTTGGNLYMKEGLIKTNTSGALTLTVDGTSTLYLGDQYNTNDYSSGYNFTATLASGATLAAYNDDDVNVYTGFSFAADDNDETNITLDANGKTLNMAMVMTATGVDFTATGGTVGFTNSATLNASSITVDDEATLSITGAVTLGTDSSITVANDATLSLDGSITLTESSQISFDTGSSLSLGDDASFELSYDLFTAGEYGNEITYQIFSGDGLSSITALTAEDINLTGFDLTGYTFSYENGTITYRLDITNLTYSGGASFDWGLDEKDEVVFNGGNDYYTHDAMVTFNSLTTATLTSDISPTYIKIEGDGTVLTIGNGDIVEEDGTGYQITTEAISFGAEGTTSTLIITDDVLASTTKVGTGGNTAASFIVNLTDGTESIDYSKQLNAFAGNLEVQAGDLTVGEVEGANTTLSYNSVEVSGGSLTLGLALDTTSIEVSGGSATFNGAVTTDAIELSGGTTTFSNALTVDGALTANGGTLYLNGTSTAASLALSNSSSITIGDDASLNITNAMTTTGGTVTGDLTVGSISATISATSGTTTFNGTVSVGAVTITGGGLDTVVFNDAVTSSGTLTVSGSSTVGNKVVTFNSGDSVFSQLSISSTTSSGNNGGVVLGANASLTFTNSASSYGNHIDWYFSEGSSLNFESTVNVQGGGIWDFYYVGDGTDGATVNYNSGLKMGTNGTGSTINIDENVTVNVEDTFYLTSSYTSSANTTNYSGNYATLNIDGVFKSTATSIQTYGSLSGKINVNEGGTLILDYGLTHSVVECSATDSLEYNTTHTINVEGILQLGNQAEGSAVDYSSTLTVYLNDGAVLQALDTTTTVAHTFEYGEGAITFDGNDNSLILTGVIDATATTATIAGNVTFAGTTTNLAAAYVNSGASLSINVAADITLITLDGGSLEVAGTLSNALAVTSNDGTLSSNSDDGLVLSSTITLSDGSSLSLSDESVSLSEGFSLVLDSWTFDADTTYDIFTDLGTDIYADNGNWSVTGADLTGYEAIWTYDEENKTLILSFDLIVGEIAWDPTSGSILYGADAAAYADANISVVTTGVDNATLNAAVGNSVASLAISGENALTINGDTALVVTDNMTIANSAVTVASGTGLDAYYIAVTSGSLTVDATDLSVDLLNVNGGAVTINGDSTAEVATELTLEGLSLTSGSLTVGDNVSIVEGDGATAAYMTTAGTTTNSFTLDLGDNSSLSSDAKLNIEGGSTVTITGEGVYSINGLQLSTANTDATSLVINEDATLQILAYNGDIASEADGNLRYAVNLGQWAGTNTITVNGTLLINEALAANAGSTTISVSGTLQLNSGLDFTKMYSSTPDSYINVLSGGILALGNGSDDATDYLVVTMDSGSTIASTKVESGIVTVNAGITYDSGTITFDGTDATLKMNSAVSNIAATASIVGDVVFAGGTSLSAVTLTNGSSLTFSGTNNSFTTLTFGPASDTTTINESVSISLEADAEVTINSGAGTATQTAAMTYASEINIDLAEGSLLTQNTAIWTNTGSGIAINVTGDGTYNLTSLLTRNGKENGNAVLTIGTADTIVDGVTTAYGDDTTMHITCITTTSSAGGFVLNGGVNSTYGTEVNIYGTLILDSGINNYTDTTATLTVYSGGTLQLNRGTYVYGGGASRDDTSLDVIISDGATLLLGNATSDGGVADSGTDYGSNADFILNSGATVLASGQTLNSSSAFETYAVTDVYTTFTYGEGATVNFGVSDDEDFDGATTLVMHTAVGTSDNAIGANIVSGIVEFAGGSSLAGVTMGDGTSLTLSGSANHTTGNITLAADATTDYDLAITATGINAIGSVSGADSVSVSGGGTTTFSGAVSVDSVSLDNSTVTFNESLAVTGALSLESTGTDPYNAVNTFTGAVSAESMTIQYGKHYFNNTVDVTNAITLNGGISTFTGNVTAASIDANDGTTMFKGSLNVSGASTIDASAATVSVETLTGTGNVTVSAGSLLLKATDDNYTGTLTLAGGSLTAADSLSYGDTTVTATAGTLNTDITVTANSTLSASVLNSTITLGTGISLALDGDVTFGDDFSIVLSSSDAGSYTIFTGAGTTNITGLDYTDLSGYDTGNYTYTWTNVDGTIYLEVVSATIGDDLVWNASDGNWEDSNGNYAGSGFTENNDLTFATSSSESSGDGLSGYNPTVTVTGTQESGTLTVEGTGTATLSGDADSSLTTSGVEVNDGATLVVGTALSTSGESKVEVNNGTVSVSGDGSINSDITLGVAASDDGATEATTGTAVAGIIKVEGQGASIVDGVLSEDQIAGGTVSGGATVTVDKSLVTEHADGNATLDGGSIDSDSTLVVNEGSTLELVNGATVSADTTLADNASVKAGYITVTGQSATVTEEGSSSTLVDYSDDGALSDSSLTNALVSNATITVSGVVPTTQSSSVEAVSMVRTFSDDYGISQASEDDEVVEGTTTISGTTFADDTTIELLNGANLTLQDVVIGDDTTFTETEVTSATVTIIDSTVEASTESNSLTIATSTDSTTGVSTNTFTIDTFSSLTNTTVTASGELSIVLNLTDTQWTTFFEDFADDYTYEFILAGVSAIADADSDSVADSLNVTISIANGNDVHVFADSSAMIVGSSLVITAVPEPSTSALSLMALAGLLARRRRKA